MLGDCTPPLYVNVPAQTIRAVVAKHAGLRSDSERLPDLIELDENGCQWAAAAIPPTDSSEDFTDTDTESPFVAGCDRDIDRHGYNRYSSWALKHPDRAQDQHPPITPHPPHRSELMPDGKMRITPISSDEDPSSEEEDNVAPTSVVHMGAPPPPPPPLPEETPATGRLSPPTPLLRVSMSPIEKTHENF